MSKKEIVLEIVMATLGTIFKKLER